MRGMKISLLSKVVPVAGAVSSGWMEGIKGARTAKAKENNFIVVKPVEKG